MGVPSNKTADVIVKLAATGGTVGHGSDQPRAGDSADSGSPSDRVLLVATIKRRV